jgi:serine/threonine-protein kinase PpkA
MTDVQIPGFRLIRMLGEGGMATVHLAVQESLDREVALKVMSPTLAANAAFCEQFMKEGRIAAKLTHPHLMTVHDIGEENGVYYLASEYLPAGTLRDRMEGIGVAEALEIACDVAAGLAYAHENGFVHRDVKPGNIMFRADGTAVLADFGIAKAIKTAASQTMTGNQAIGTPDYMSPEQAQANPVDGRSDLYSLGAVLFECLAGHKPYRAGDPYTVALMHVTEPVPKLPDQLQWLQPLIDRLMAKNPDARFMNGDAFIAECDGLVAQHPEIQPRGATRATRKRKTMPRAEGIPSAPSEQSSSPVWNLQAARLGYVGLGVAALIAIAGGWYWTHRMPAPESVQATVAPVLPAMHVPPAAESGEALAKVRQLDLPALLARGEQYFADGKNNYGEHFEWPPGENAIDVFQEVLKRDPDNAVAKERLNDIAAYYQVAANDLYKNEVYGTAADLVEKGLRADPKNTALLKLKQDLAKAPQGG